jgi:hypothetical protein
MRVELINGIDEQLSTEHHQAVEKLACSLVFTNRRFRFRQHVAGV